MTNHDHFFSQYFLSETHCYNDPCLSMKPPHCESKIKLYYALTICEKECLSYFPIKQIMKHQNVLLLILRLALNTKPLGLYEQFVVTLPIKVCTNAILT